jgi:hypothetical protein
MKPVPCVICHKRLDEAIPDSTNQPYKATTFMTHGHYGSTFFDPMDGSYLEINVCDECLERVKSENKIYHYRGKKVTTYV